MTRKFLIALGTLLLGLYTAPAASAQLYDRIRSDIQRELLVQQYTPDLPVKIFVAKTLEARWGVTPQDVERALKGEKEALCADRVVGSNQIAFQGECETLFQTILELTAREQAIRSVGRRLQASATSYELLVGNPPSALESVPLHLVSILRIWKPGKNTASTTGFPIRTLERWPGDDAPGIQATVAQLRSALQSIHENPAVAEEQRIAAVWRYSPGVRLVRAERAPAFPAPQPMGDASIGMELQYLGTTWDAVENALEAIWTQIPKDPASFVPPLLPEEVAYLLFPNEVFPGVRVWARVDGDLANGNPDGDVGLQWAIPLDPVTPSLLAANGPAVTPILGGTYPPSAGAVSGNPVPWEGNVVCSHPLARKGYLCRPRESPSPCREEIDPPPNTIVLTACTEKEGDRWCCGGDTLVCRQMSAEQCRNGGGEPFNAPTECVAAGCSAPSLTEHTRTIAGADVCQGLDWRTESFDPDVNCHVTVTCGGTCPKMFYGRLDPSATTLPKDANGTIAICIGDDSPIPATYRHYRELVRAYQACDKKPSYTYYCDNTLTGEEANTLCCRSEGEVFRAQCELMEQDGLIPMGGAQECAEALTDLACQPEPLGEISDECHEKWKVFEGCPQSGVPAPSGEFATLVRVPETCEESLALPDRRVLILTRTLADFDDLCAPENMTQFHNSIGNELCFLGQCIERSAERHRLTGGRTPFGVVDEAFPFDSRISPPSLLGALRAAPGEFSGPLPIYRPALLARHIDQMLCQPAGKPPVTPPVLCEFPMRRRLQFPSRMYPAMLQSLQAQSAEELLPSWRTQTLSAAIGIRYGTQMYAEYLEGIVETFTALIRSTVELLTGVRSVSFTPLLCPLGSAAPSP